MKQSFEDIFPTQSKNIFSWKKYWAKRFGTAPFLPMSRAEMEVLGWDSCDIILVTGDAYVDHPSFGMAIIGRLLESQGFRVGIISQPDWRSADAFKALGRPNLFYGVTSGNMDSMVNRYTADRKIRSDDAYSPDGKANQRPDRAVIVYAQRCREAFADTPVVLGSIEASLRRIAHYDYWSEKVRRSVLIDAKADILLYGNAERAIVELAHRLSAGEKIGEIRNLRGSAFVVEKNWCPAEGWTKTDATTPEASIKPIAHTNPYEPESACRQDTNAPATISLSWQQKREHNAIRIPAYEVVKDSALHYAHASRLVHLESNPGNARCIIQAHGDKDLWVNPPPHPLSTEELDGVYAFAYQRLPHPAYHQATIPAFEMIKHSVSILRGCFGGCTFCSITAHEGRIIQSRSESSVISEIEEIRSKGSGFTGIISDLGGATANMYKMGCKDKTIESMCRRFSCLYPEPCRHLNTDHEPLIDLYRKARDVKGIKKILIGSGVRYDIAIKSPEYVKELVSHHVGGYLKIAPEHTEKSPLAHMLKPDITAYEKFKILFDKFSQQAGKEQYLIPYFIAAHPGTTDEDMLNLALWLKRNKFRPDQVQTFLPTPMALATTMYHSGLNPLKKIEAGKEALSVVKGERQRRLHKAFLRYHDPQNWPLLREALRRMGRSDLIGAGKRHLIPLLQPVRLLKTDKIKPEKRKTTRKS